MMETQSVAGVACADLHQAMARIDDATLTRLEQAIAEANAIFVFGAGRSLLMLKAVAMRLMHIGLKVHVVGDVVTPALQEGDLLLLASASGETASLVNVATKAQQLGGTVALLTIFPESTLGKLAEVVVRIPAYTDKLPDGPDNVKGILPGGSLFEEAVMVLGDAMIVNLAQSTGYHLTKGFALHANLE
ncbi:3-hexulose-6-phosphate isomerase [Citrobacter youngae]|nr:3-hexulose-6-phosphate isomerase [Citrobacter youngae]